MDEKTKKQIIALIKAAQNGNQKAILAIQQIQQQAKQGDQLAAALVEAMNAVAQELQGQAPKSNTATIARFGAKLNYLRSIKGSCPEGQELVYFKEGGRICKKCVGKAAEGKKVDGKLEINNFKKKKACGGAKMKK